MQNAVSKRASLSAATLVVLHVLAFAYVQANNVLYDQNDLEGLLWWLVALWVLPLLALSILIVSLVRRLLANQDRGK